MFLDFNKYTFCRKLKFYNLNNASFENNIGMFMLYPDFKF